MTLLTSRFTDSVSPLLMPRCVQGLQTGGEAERAGLNGTRQSLGTPALRGLLTYCVGVLRYDIVGCGEVVAQEHAAVLNRLRTEGLLTVRACIDTSLDRAVRMAKRLHATPAASITEAGVSDADVA